MERICPICGEGFAFSPSRNMKYCSRECTAAGKIVGNVICICEICGKAYLVKPWRRSKGTRYCSKRCLGKARAKGMTGENHPSWKGGITPENKAIRASAEYGEWHKAVFARDNWTCQDCGMKSKDIHAHHIFTFADFPEHRFSVWNGVTLCAKCHRRTHSKNPTYHSNDLSKITLEPEDDYSD